MGSASEQDGYFRRDEERGWILLKAVKVAKSC